MRVGYARVSSRSQNLDRQLDRLGKLNLDHIVTEKKSGDAERPDLDALVESLSSGDELVVDDIDRLSRSLYQLLGLFQACHDKGVKICVVERHIDHTTVSGFCEVVMKGFSAQLQLMQIRTNAERGRAVKRSRGETGGRPRALSKNQRVALLDMVLNGKSKHEICSVFEVSRGAVYKIIEDAILEDLEGGEASPLMAQKYHVSAGMVARIELNRKARAHKEGA